MDYLKIFFLSMVPVVELRGAGIYSQYLDLPIVQSYLICVLGNMLPVPFIYLFARKLLNVGATKPVVGGLCRFLLEKGERTGGKLRDRAGRVGLFFALMLFVGIPIPGTGAWTGTLAASILDGGFRNTTLSVMLGVLLAGVIMMSAGVLGFSLL